MDGVVREMYAGTEANWMNLLGVDGSCQVLFTDDTGLVAYSEDRLQKLLLFGRVCNRKN